jgi:hypothetical protein
MMRCEKHRQAVLIREARDPVENDDLILQIER